MLIWLKRVDMKCTRGKGKGCKCCAKSKKPGNEESPAAAAALNLAEFTAMCEAPEAAAEEGGGGSNSSPGARGTAIPGPSGGQGAAGGPATGQIATEGAGRDGASPSWSEDGRL